MTRSVRLQERLLDGRPPSWKEGGWCLAGLLGLAAIVYGSHVADGNFYSDDWANQSYYQHADEPRLWNTFDRFWTTLGGRPLLALFLAIPHAVFGDDPQPHLALAVVLAVMACAAFYVLLRELGLPPLHAGAVSALALLFPWTDSTRLWATTGLNNIAVLFYLCGIIVAVRGLRREPKIATPRQALAVLLLVLSVLTYEAAGALALASLLPYMLVAPRRLAVRRWLVDVVCVGAALIWSAAATAPVRGVGNWWTAKEHLDEYARGAISMLGNSFLPLGAPVSVLAAATVVVGVAAVLIWRGGPSGPARSHALRWGAIALFAAAGVALAYTSFLTYELWPGRTGIYNRGNVTAAFPFALLVYSLCMLVGALLSATRHRWHEWSLGVAAILVALVVVGYADRLIADKDEWRIAAAMESEAIETLQEALPELEAGSTIYTFNYPAQVSPGIPIFSDTWDLRGAVRINWDDGSLGAYPIFGDTTFVCEADGMYPEGGKEFYFLEAGHSAEEEGRYGKTFAVDLRTGEVERIDGVRRCKSLLSRMTPGPSYLKS